MMFMTKLVQANSQFQINQGFGTEEFGALLEKAMERPSKFSKKTSFAPSGLGYSGSCPRYWYYAFNGADFEYDTDGPAMANMDAGSDAGRRLANVLDKAGILEDSEIPVKHQDPPIGGFIDAMVRWKGEIIPAEIKTTKSATWQVRANANTVPGYQLVQLLIYMYVTNNQRGFFLTENKDTHELFILPVRMTEEHKQLVERIFDWMRLVKKNAEEGELPIRPFTKSSMQCKGCPVKNKCYEGVTRGKVNGKDPAPGTINLPVLELPK